MKFAKYSWLVAGALYELIRYDVFRAISGSVNIDRQLSRRSFLSKPPSREAIRTTCNAVSLAACLYWKPVLCLQRSICLVRLLRKQNVACRLVIGYRPVPFVSHAWVEVDGRIVNDSPTFQRRLQVLYTA
jgi:transglutaminase superfamily protein